MTVEAYAVAQNQVARLLALLETFVDDAPCHFDHHGNCQTHYLGNPCNVALARAELAVANSQQDSNLHAASRLAEIDGIDDAEWSAAQMLDTSPDQFSPHTWADVCYLLLQRVRRLSADAGRTDG